MKRYFVLGSVMILASLYLWAGSVLAFQTRSEPYIERSLQESYFTKGTCGYYFYIVDGMSVDNSKDLFTLYIKTYSQENAISQKETAVALISKLFGNEIATWISKNQDCVGYACPDPLNTVIRNHAVSIEVMNEGNPNGFISYSVSK
jgi:hypothetical protein